MSALYALYIYSGRIAWPIQLPLMRVFIKRTHRVYAIIRDKDKVLLTKNWLGDGRWALPGGGVARHESSEQALARELEEEIGVNLPLTQAKLLSAGKWQTHGLGFDYEIYGLESRVKHGAVRRLEITEVSWVKISDLNDSNIAREILESINNL